MIYFVIGLPGQFTEWCHAAAAEIAKRALGPTELIRADSLAEISVAMIRTGAERAVVASRQPGGRLRSALVEAGRNFIVVVEDPRTALAEAVDRQPDDVAGATQLVASSCAGIIRYISSPGALALFRARDGASPEATARAIAHHLALSVCDGEITEIVKELAAAGQTFEHSGDVVGWDDGLEAEARRIIRGALDPFVTYLATGVFPPIAWERELFFLGDRPNERTAGLIDVTGRARCLLHGPYIMLPPGPWSLSLNLLFSGGAVDHDFLIEVVGDQQVASCTVRPEAEGLHEVNLQFTLDATTDHPIAIRLSTQRAAFDGTVALVRANLSADGAALPGRPTAVAAPTGAADPAA
jgi:hypothetical protein